MDKQDLRNIWWSFVIMYLALIYATLGAATIIWDTFDDFLGGKGVLAIFVIGVIAGIALLPYMAFIKKERSINNYFLLMLFVFMFLVLNKLAVYAVDKVHMIEYAVLSILLYNALKIDVDRFDIKLYIIGSLVCLVAGSVDEALQWVMPDRYFDWRDIWLNFLSSITAFAVIRYNILKR